MAVGACSAPSWPVIVFDNTEISVGDTSLNVALADKPEERRQGLMDVDELPGGIDGMLFAYPDPTSASYTMRDTPLPLDIWWFDEDGALVGSAEMEPCLEGSCTSYASPGPVRWVLETPRGRYGFEPGATLSTADNG